MIIFVLFLIITSEDFRDWEKKRMKKLREERERTKELRKIREEEIFRERGRMRGKEEYGIEKRERYKKNKAIQDFLNNPFGI